MAAISIERVGTGMERDWPADMLGHLAQVVDTVAMIGMVMGDDHTGKVGRTRVKQLPAQIGTAIDQQSSARAFDQDR